MAGADRQRTERPGHPFSRGLSPSPRMPGLGLAHRCCTGSLSGYHSVGKFPAILFLVKLTACSALSFSIPTLPPRVISRGPWSAHSSTPTSVAPLCLIIPTQAHYVAVRPCRVGFCIRRSWIGAGWHGAGGRERAKRTRLWFVQRAPRLLLLLLLFWLLLLLLLLLRLRSVHKAWNLCRGTLCKYNAYDAPAPLHMGWSYVPIVCPPACLPV